MDAGVGKLASIGLAFIAKDVVLAHDYQRFGKIAQLIDRGTMRLVRIIINLTRRYILINVPACTVFAYFETCGC